MFVGGLRALLLQSLHPLAMAGVAGHSGYRSDPWGRLARTSTFLAYTTFATADDAQQMVDRVRAVHERVRGKTSDGRPYRASDPHLLTWVHVAEADSFLAAHQRYGERPLNPVEVDEYVAQSARVARALGAERVPETVADLAATIESYRSELEASPEALDAASFLLREPPLPRPVRAPYGMLAAGAVALLPAWAGRPAPSRCARSAGAWARPRSATARADLVCPHRPQPNRTVTPASRTPSSSASRPNACTGPRAPTPGTAPSAARIAAQARKRAVKS
jgi:uncharacterized protein (DUF2236 family)